MITQVAQILTEEQAKKKEEKDRKAKLRASGEDYLEAILMIQKKKGMVRSVDLAHHMGFSKPSISHAVSVLRDGGFLTVEEDGYLHLTNASREIAEKIYERHYFFTAHLIELGGDPVQAEQDVCRLEHVISEESYQILKKSILDGKGKTNGN